MVLDDVLKCLGGSSPNQRKVLARQIIVTDFFLTTLIATYISHEQARLKTLLAFDTEMYETLIALIDIHPDMEISTKKKLQHIENHVYKWMTAGDAVDHHEVYEVLFA